MQNTTTISQKGQIVVPKDIRDILNIKASDTLSVNLEGKKIIVEPVTAIDEIFGSFKTNKAITKNDIKKASKNYLLKKYKLTSK